jgi:hypothetical protein
MLQNQNKKGEKMQKFISELEPMTIGRFIWIIMLLIIMAVTGYYSYSINM